MTKKRLPKLIILLGPTATGKTKLAIKLAQKFKGEIVSADSRQVYQGMNIGTGKDLKSYQLTNNKKQKASIRSHLIDIVKPDQDFNLAQYKKFGLKVIKDILSRGKVPFLVGGTGLYISALVDNYQIPQVKPDKKVRKKLEKLDKLKKLKILKKLDPDVLDLVDINNPRRLDRALEVCLSGQKFSQARKKGQPLFDTLLIGLTLPPRILSQRIEKRVNEMIKQGLVGETKKLIKKYGKNALALQSIGYQEFIDYLNENDEERRLIASLPQAINLIKLHTRQFAKRQMTWFKRDKRIKWIKNQKAAEKLIKAFLLYRNFNNLSV